VKDWQLPANWQLTTLGEVGHFESGGTPSTENESYWNGNIPFLTGADITRFNISRENARSFLSEEGIRSGKTVLCPPGTVLFVTRTRVGRVGVAREAVAVSQDLSPYLCSARVLPEFVCWYLLGISEYLMANARGATILGLTRDFAASIPIPLPPLPEQRRIAALLAKQMAAVEEARESAETQLKAAEALAAAYLREVFEGEEAQGWRRVPFGEAASITASIVDPTLPEYRDLPHISGVNIESRTGRLVDIRSAAEDRMMSGKYLFDPGDVLYSKLRPYLRKASYVDFRGLCSADMYPIKIDKDILDAHFTAWMLLSDDFTAYADGESRRARMPKLNREALFAYKAPIPALSRQREIADTLQSQVDALDHVRAQLQEQVSMINSLPTALLRQAFNGEL